MLENIHSPADLKTLTLAQMTQLAQDLRERIIAVVSRNGGHLASNLGVVEATIAIHRVFNSPRDRIVWDVGHQSYAHKLLTGRGAEFDTLRTFGGLSGFPKRSESVHDVFETGHSSTSISAALGMARARDLRGEDHDVLAFIGDGSLTGGMAYEAINDVGHSGTRLIIVINDNEMSIGRNVGALSQVLSRIRYKRQYTRAKYVVQRVLRRIPWVGHRLADLIERMKNAFKYLFVTGVFFEELGFAYIGPVDGHDIAAVSTALEHARLFDRPVVVHISTQKGRGHPRAENSPEHYHSVGPADAPKCGASFAKLFAAELAKLAETDRRVVAITASMTEGCGLDSFRRLYPERFFDVGIAEQHAVTMAAGMAAEGLRPVFAVYSTFLQRSYDQILHDVCLQRLNVIFAVSHCGLVGEDGETHQGIYTLSYLGHIPGLRVLCPVNAAEVKAMLRLAMTLDGPTAICFPKGAPAYAGALAPGDGLRWTYALQEPQAACAILAVGSRMVSLAARAAALCRQGGLIVDVVNCSTVKPLDECFLREELPHYRLAMTLEENILTGGFGAHVLETLANSGGAAVPIIPYGLREGFVPQGTVAEQMAAENLTAEAVAQRLLAEKGAR